MKKIFFLFAAFITGLTVMAQQQPDDVVKANSEKYEFGKIKQGVPVTTYFELTNLTDKPLVLENVWAGCGCTTPEWSKEPIPAKGTTKIKVGYNAANAGPFTKDVYIKLAGIQQPKDLKITGEVLDANAYEAYTKTDEYKNAQKTKEQESKSSKKLKKTTK